MVNIQVNTTQNVKINFVAASLGQRIVSFLIDIVIIGVYLLTAFYFASSLGLRFSDQWSNIAIVSIINLPAMFYTIISETFLNGQSVGKKIMKIKVIKIDGYQANFFDYFIRWVFRIIDIFVNFGVVALLSIVLSDKSQRLGDFASGTSVINIKNSIQIDHTILEEIEEAYVPTFLSVIRLSDNDIQIIKDAFLTAKKSKDLKTIIKLRKKVEEIIEINKGDISDKEFISTVLKDYTHLTQN